MKHIDKHSHVKSVVPIMEHAIWKVLDHCYIMTVTRRRKCHVRQQLPIKTLVTMVETKRIRILIQDVICDMSIRICYIITYFLTYIYPFYVSKNKSKYNILKKSGYQNIDEVNVCPLCDNSLEETVMHFILHCPKYTIIRSIFLDKIERSD